MAIAFRAVPAGGVDDRRVVVFNSPATGSSDGIRSASGSMPVGHGHYKVAALKCASLEIRGVGPAQLANVLHCANRHRVPVSIIERSERQSDPPFRWRGASGKLFPGGIPLFRLVSGNISVKAQAVPVCSAG